MEFDSKPLLTFLSFVNLGHYDFSAENIKQEEPLNELSFTRFVFFSLDHMLPSPVAHLCDMEPCV